MDQANRCEWSDTDATHQACRDEAHVGLLPLNSCKEARRRDSSELDRGNEAEETGQVCVKPSRES